MTPFSRAAGAVALSLCTSFTSIACGPLRPTISVGGLKQNIDLFTDQADYESRAKKLHNGVSPDDAFATMGVDKTRFIVLKDKERMDAAFGGASPQPRSEEEMRRIMDLLTRVTVYRMTYQDQNKKVTVGVDKTDFKSSGFDRQITLIFLDGKLTNSTAEPIAADSKETAPVLTGNPTINETEQIYTIPELGKQLPRALIGGAKMAF